MIKLDKFKEEFESDAEKKTKDDQSIQEIEHIIEEQDKLQEAKNIYCKVFKINKGFYHVLKVLKEIAKEEQVFFSRNRAYDDLEHGKHLD